MATRCNRRRNSACSRRSSRDDVIVEWLTGATTDIGPSENIADVQFKILTHVHKTFNEYDDAKRYTCGDILLLNVDSVIFTDPVARAPNTIKAILRTGQNHRVQDSYWVQALLAHAHCCPGDASDKTGDWRHALPEHCIRVAEEMMQNAEDSTEVANSVLLNYCANGGTNPHIIHMLCDDDFCDADEDTEDKEEENVHIYLGAPLVGSTPLMYAAYHGHLAVCEALVENKADLNWYSDDGQWTALDIAARRDNSEVAQFLFDCGAKIQRNREGGALHVAAEYGSVKTLQVLLEAKDAHGHPIVDINLSDEKGETALHWAVESDQGSATLFLGHMKADLNRRNYGGETPLYRACYQGSVKCVECLLELKAQLNIATSPKHNKLTPLHVCAQQGPVSLVELLLEAGADPTLLDAEDHTPMQRAILFGGHVVADVFRQYGCKL